MKYLAISLLMFFSSNKNETQPYEVIFSDNKFEIRFYPSALKAKVVSNNNSNSSFYKLFQFISGNNSKKEKIAMTTPVYMKNNEKTNTMEFVMPSSFNIQSISKPNDRNVVIFKSDPKYYACIRYGGYSNTKKFKQNLEKLIEKLANLNIKTIGNSFYASYNSPYKVVGRRNEVMIEIDYKN